MNEYDDETQETQVSEKKNWRRALEEERDTARTEAEETRKKLEDATKRLAIAEAGLKLTPKQIAALSNVHEGEWDADSVKATASELFGIKVDNESTDEIPQEEKDAQNRVISNSKDAGDSASLPNYLEEIGKAETQEEVMAAAQRAGMPTTWDGQ